MNSEAPRWLWADLCGKRGSSVAGRLFYKPIRTDSVKYRRDDVSPAWLANCCQCGRVVDTREPKDGGDQHGAELDDGRWVCSSNCWDRALPGYCGEGME